MSDSSISIKDIDISSSINIEGLKVEFLIKSIIRLLIEF